MKLLSSTLLLACVLVSGCGGAETSEDPPAPTATNPTDQAFHKALIDRYGIVTVGSDAPKYQEIACREPDPSKAGVEIATFNRQLTIKQGKDVAAVAVEVYCPR